MLLITAQGNVEDAIREGFLAVDEDMLKGRHITACFVIRKT